MGNLVIRPITLQAAREYVGAHHRHNIPPVGCKFCLSLYDGDRLCGVAICGRPVGRRLDDGVTLEILRCCTDGTRNACSKLYGASCRVAKEMGYAKVITYTLASESGASLRASGFDLEAENVGGKAWNGRSRREYYVAPPEMKNRWAKKIG